MTNRLIFKGTSRLRFNNFFKSDKDCYEYLSKMKWNGDTFICKRCGNTHHCKGHLPFSRRCTRCKYDESPTAGTMFDKIKFPLLTAFHIIFEICIQEEGTSSAMLSKKYGVRQKTVWAFKQKVHQALDNQGINRLDGTVFISDFCVDAHSNFQQGNIALIVGEILSNGEIGKAYSYFVECKSPVNIRRFFEKHISIDTKVFINNNKEYGLYASNYNIENCENCSISTLIQSHILNVRNWLYRMHRHCSSEYIQGYLNEYYYRFNGRNNKSTMFDNFIELMMHNHPVRDSTISK